MDVIDRLWADIQGYNGTVGVYAATYRLFLAGSIAAFGASLLINAPFGRFSQKSGWLNINANLGWWIMEIVSPISFLVGLTGEPLSATPSYVSLYLHPFLTLVAGLKNFISLGISLDSQNRLARFNALSTPVKFLAGCFVVHYINRSTISVLRQHSKRTPMNVIVPLVAVVWNLANGSLMGSWLGGRTLPMTNTVVNKGALPGEAFQTPAFWACIGLWFAGFIGNIYHDDILNNLRKPGKDGKQPPRYSIPHGGLYSFPFGGISFPSYFCEWLEWTGFALACSLITPPPALPSSVIADARSLDSLSAIVKSFWAFVLGVINQIRFAPAYSRNSPLLEAATYLTPPWVFLYNEVGAMLPRAIAGHRWYKDKFGAQFPRNRKVVLPGVF